LHKDSFLFHEKHRVSRGIGEFGHNSGNNMAKIKENQDFGHENGPNMAKKGNQAFFLTFYRICPPAAATSLGVVTAKIGRKPRSLWLHKSS